jgi:hypothetical protein
MSNIVNELRQITSKFPPNINYRIIVNYSVKIDNTYILSVKDTKYFIGDYNQPLNITIESDELIYDFYGD